MNLHPHHLISRIRKAAMRAPCRYRVVAVGFDHRGTAIGLTTNIPRLENRGYHAEERLIHTTPKSLSKILIARVGARGDFLPIDPCVHCAKLARKFEIKIESLRV